LRGAAVPDFRYRAGEDEETELGFSLFTFLWFYLMVENREVVDLNRILD